MLPREALPSSESNYVTPQDILSAQLALEEEAAEAIPFNFSECTYPMGYIRQPVFACRTCATPDRKVGVCYGCSVQCHGDHDLVELFARRHFKCDCNPCSIDPGTRRDSHNPGNLYGPNFDGIFCACKQKYDPEEERDTMYECLACQDWFHHRCLFGVPDTEDASDFRDAFEVLICNKCIVSDGRLRAILAQYAGVPGTGVLLWEGGSERSEGGVKQTQAVTEQTESVVGGGDCARTSETTASSSDAELTPKKQKTSNESTQTDIPTQVATTEATPIASDAAALADSGEGGSGKALETEYIAGKAEKEEPHATHKRPFEGESPDPAAKKLKVIDGCTKPVLAGEPPLSLYEKENPEKLNVYLAPGYTKKFCKCSRCLGFFVPFQYLVEEEETYEPTEDPDALKSTFDLGMEALTRMPKQKAIEGLMAFRDMSDKFKAYIRPLAEQGKVITKDVVDSFFKSNSNAGSR